MTHRFNALPPAFCAAIVVSFLCVGVANAATCDSLTSLKLPNTAILSAQLQPAGRFTQPGAPPNAPANPALATLPVLPRGGVIPADTRFRHPD